MEHNKFYDSPEWKHKRAEILERDHFECVHCRAHGRYTRAVIVHHVQHLEYAPELALSDTYTDGRGAVHRQLISVCRDCHESVCHPERLKRYGPAEPVTAERWD